MTAWYDNDAFWEDVAPVIFTEDRQQKAREDVGQIVALIGLQPSATVLDMGCGPGRHALEFARRGYRVTGVDRTATYLAKADKAAQKEELKVEWVEADMRHYRCDDMFDVAVSLLTSFGYFEDPSEDSQVVENLFASLKPGGHLVMDLMGKEVLARIFRERDWHEESDGTVVLEERKVAADWSRIHVRWVLIQGERRREHRFGHRVYSAMELMGLLGRIGFADIKAYGSLAGAGYDHEAERLVMVARKPGAS